VKQQKEEGIPTRKEERKRNENTSFCVFRTNNREKEREKRKYEREKEVFCIVLAKKIRKEYL